MSDLPALPNDIDANAPVVEYHAMQCRKCDEMAPWANEDDESHPAYEWMFTHAKENEGHTRFYRWSVARNTANVGL